MPAIHVTLFGKRLVWLKSEDSNWGPMTDPDHVDDSGRLRLEHARACDSYAHVFLNGEIRRYGTIIGTVDDLVPVTP